MVSGFGVKLGNACSTLLFLKVFTQTFVSLLTFIKIFNVTGIEFMTFNFSLKVPLVPKLCVNSKCFPCDLKCHIYHTFFGGGHRENVTIDLQAESEQRLPTSSSILRMHVPPALPTWKPSKDTALRELCAETVWSVYMTEFSSDLYINL